MFVAGIFVGVGISVIGATIGYFWGSYTYARDFARIEEALKDEGTPG